MLDRVAFSGKIDLTQGDPRDRRWWERLRIAIRQVRLEQEVTLCQSRFQYQLFSAMLCEPGSPGRSQAMDLATAEHEKLDKMLRPWLFKEVVQKDPKNDWQENFGDMNSEETKRAMAITKAWLEDLAPPIQEDF